MSTDPRPSDAARKECPHCPDGHRSPARCHWGVRVAPDRDSDGQPTHLIVQPTAGQHVAQADADWLWAWIRTWRPTPADTGGTDAGPVVLSWDYRQQPDWDKLTEVIRDMSDGSVHLHQVGTDSDEYAIVLAPKALAAAEVEDVYTRWYEGDHD